ncbi:hypothetical protein B0J14DRAFT_305734 [Halenospora varia]|nr:hypothetical protein B0J14DRAFT_305734 [Halenospora varia]
MSSLPDFSNEALFPAFINCPLTSEVPPNFTATSNEVVYFLLGTIQENMTLTPRTPTYIIVDRQKTSFACTIKLKFHQELGKENGWDGKGFKKGWTMVIRNAVRKGYQEEDAEAGKKEKKGFVESGWREEGGVQVIPTSLENLLAMSAKWKEDSKGEKKCQGCGKGEGESKMVKCKGCESVWYCGKECQVEGWSEKGHKSECKVLKSVREIFLEP